MHSERTQVLLSPEQRSRLERIATRENRSMGAVIRDAIDAYTISRIRSRDEALQVLFSQNAPVADWEVMKAEIERGALGSKDYGLSE
ncbi:MAG: CopG family transcriptional regulator [Candidatus Limnocylindrales bacterium]